MPIEDQGTFDTAVEILNNMYEVWRLESIEPVRKVSG
jgi:hypothetical protein